jgi:phosphohistidine phosphatase
MVSTAARTRETWVQLAQAFAKAPTASFEARIYNASPAALLKPIQETQPETGTLLVIGHNPGLQELANLLIASGEVDARRRLGEEFPTAALAAISFAADDWRAVHPHGGRLEHFVTPHWLETATD